MCFILFLYFFVFRILRLVYSRTRYTYYDTTFKKILFLPVEHTRLLFASPLSQDSWEAINKNDLPSEWNASQKLILTISRRIFVIWHFSLLIIFLSLFLRLIWCWYNMPLEYATSFSLNNCLVATCCQISNSLLMRKSPGCRNNKISIKNFQEEIIYVLTMTTR